MALLDKKLEHAIVRYLANTVRVWNDTQESKLPRCKIKATRGPEIIYRGGIYRATVELSAESKAKPPPGELQDAVTIAAQWEATLLDTADAHGEINIMEGVEVYIFAIESLGSESTTEGDNRMRKLKLEVICAEVDPVVIAEDVDVLTTDLGDTRVIDDGGRLVVNL